MKYICTPILVYLFFPILSIAQAGSSCSSPHTIPLDGVTRNYAVSGSTGGASLCSISGNSPITYFQFTTNAAGDMPLLDITAPGGSNCEVLLYLGSCTNGNLILASSMCFWDAAGLWAPAHDYTVLANTTYKLRIKTTTTGNISISGISYAPPNNSCSGATQIGPTLKNDNNATHRPPPPLEIVPGQLCATTLENTAYYTYTVETTGPTVLSIENTSCDNQDGPAQVGFQVGFFTGSCSSLWWLQCYAGAGTTIAANTGILTAGTQVFVAVDGLGGSNCRYGVRAINSIELSVNLKYFSAWKEQAGNVLKWISTSETNNDRFEIQRAIDGSNFHTIGTKQGQINSSTEKKYEFMDYSSPEICYYRLKQVSTSGKNTYSNVIKVERSMLPGLRFKMNNPVSGTMNMSITSSKQVQSEIYIRNINGQVVFRDKLTIQKGFNNYSRDLSFLASGLYSVSLKGEEMEDSQSLIKL
jgi:hypothetical protein